jgi:F-type H+-transporting ATPase subunit a
MISISSMLASATPEGAHDVAAGAHSAVPAAEHAAGGGHGPAEALMHHVLDHPAKIFFTNVEIPSKHLMYIVVAALAVLFIVRLAMKRYQKGGVPTGAASLVEVLVLYVRDEIAEKNIGHHDGRKFTPLLCSFFFFILFAALIGLLPFTATPTANINVTLALATISFGAQQYAGISKFGVVHHFKNLIPPGLPLLVLPIMIVVEVLGMFTKPFALMVRLFANMLAGHMVITCLLMLIPLVAKVSVGLGIVVIPVSIGLALFIMFLEVLVAFIQAYVFTLLSAIFIGMYAHPSH